MRKNWFILCTLLASTLGAPAARAAPPADPVSDTFILMLGNRVVETLTMKESEEPGFKIFATIFPKGTSIQGGILTGPGEGQNRVSDTVEVIDLGTSDDRMIKVFSDADNPAVPNDGGETRTFTIFNFLGNPLRADRITIYSDMAVPVPEPSSLALLLGGLGAVALRAWRRRN